MSNNPAVLAYQIFYKPVHSSGGWGTQEPTTITKQQYETIQPMLNDYRFITVGDTTINTDQILKIEASVTKEKLYLLKMNGNTFYTQQEIDDYTRGL